MGFNYFSFVCWEFFFERSSSRSGTKYLQISKDYLGTHVWVGTLYLLISRRENPRD